MVSIDLSAQVVFIMDYFLNFPNHLSKFDIDDVTETGFTLDLPTSQLLGPQNFPTQTFSSCLPDFFFIHLHFLNLK